MILALAAIAWRLVFILLVVPRWEAAGDRAPFPDRYPDLALALIHTHTLSYDDTASEPAAATRTVATPVPTTTRGPGFPLWLVPGILLGGESPPWIGLWASVPGIALGVLLSVRARRIFGTAPAVVCALCALFHPLVCIASARAMGDDVYAATGVLSCWLVLAALGLETIGTTTAAAPLAGDAPRPWRMSGIMLGLGGAALLALHLLTRANGVLTVLAIVGTAALASRRAGRARGETAHPGRDDGRGRSVRWPLLAGILLAALTPALAWSVRSSRLEGRPVYVHSLGAYNFWLHQEFEESGYRFPPSTEVKAALLREAGIDPTDAAHFHWARLPPSEVARLEQGLTRAALALAAERPFTLLGRTVAGIPRFWFQASSARTTAVYAVWALPFLLLAALGAWRHLGLSARPMTRFDEAYGPSRGGPLATALLMTLVLHNALYAFVLPMARMSVQVLPALAYLAAAGSFALAGMRTRRPGEASPPASARGTGS